MKLNDFDYTLSKDLIAQYPLKERQKARLMVLDRETGAISDDVFENIINYFKEGDALVLNDTKVIPARLFAKRKTGGKVEVFLLASPEKNSLSGLEKKNPVSEVLLRPSGRLKKGEEVILESGDRVEVLDRGDIGRFVKFDRPLDEILKECGHTPLPPYIKRADEPSDKEDYQTIYARGDGATASPTAGLHFTKDLLKQIEDKGVKVCYITLHTSYGTFAPVKVDNVENHRMHAEYFNMPVWTAKTISETKKKGSRIFAVGTTSARVLEHYFSPRSTVPALPAGRHGPQSMKGYTDLYIYPPYKFKVVDCLITNFHLPKSTLLLLVSAFAGKDFIFKAYNHAIEKEYRFYSYGDAMLIV